MVEMIGNPHDIRAYALQTNSNPGPAWNCSTIAALALGAASRAWQSDGELAGASIRGCKQFQQARWISTALPAGKAKKRSLQAKRGCKQFHAAVYLAHVVFGLSQRRAGLFFSRDRTSVRYACTRIEDARDERRFDLALDALSASMRAHARAFDLRTCKLTIEKADT